MKIFRVVAFLVLSGFYNKVHGQQNALPEPVQIKEYSVVYIRALYQSHDIIYDNVGLSKSPVLAMPNSQPGMFYDTKKMYSNSPQGKFKDVGMAVNYMASYGWVLMSSNIVPYNAEKASGSVLLDVGQYSQILIFERPYQGKSEKKQ